MQCLKQVGGEGGGVKPSDDTGLLLLLQTQTQQLKQREWGGMKFNDGARRLAVVDAAAEAEGAGGNEIQ